MESTQDPKHLVKSEQITNTYHVSYVNEVLAENGIVLLGCLLPLGSFILVTCKTTPGSYLRVAIHY